MVMMALSALSWFPVCNPVAGGTHLQLWECWLFQAELLVFSSLSQNHFRTWLFEKIPCKKDLIKPGCQLSPAPARPERIAPEWAGPRSHGAPREVTWGSRESDCEHPGVRFALGAAPETAVLCGRQGLAGHDSQGTPSFMAWFV